MKRTKAIAKPTLINLCKLVVCSSVILTLGCSQPAETIGSSEPNNVATPIWPKLDIAVKKQPELEARIQEILQKMTLEQKVAQIIQPEIGDFTVEDMRRYGFGSYLNGGGSFPQSNKHATPGDWIALAESMYQASVDDSLDGTKIPTMWGTDAVHGHNNVIGATLFPHNIGLGAANNPALIKEIAGVTAREVLVTGIDWVFAPTVATVRDDRWGRTYEGYSEDPEIVGKYSAAIVEGLQGAADDNFLGEGRVISSVKHFLGDGGTVDGDDQGDNISNEQRLFDIHAQGYVHGLAAGAQTVMASFNSWNGDKIHGNQYLLTNVLKERMGFDGLVVGDWNGHGQVAGCTNVSCAQSINAGLDIFMVPTDAWKPLLENTLAQIQSGVIPMSRLDDAVTRILRVKLRAGLFDRPSPANRSLSGKTELIGSVEHREVAKQAVRESLVLLKNKNQLLPLSPNTKVLMAGDAADNIGKQSGGWTITWQGTGNDNSDFPGGSSIYAGVKEAVNAAGGSVELAVDGQFTHKPDVAIVVFGEEPYAEGNGDLDNLEYQRGKKRDLALLRSLQEQGIPVVSVFITGRPLWVNPELNASDAFVVAWLPGSEGSAVADVLFTKVDGQIQHDFKGKLSFSWPKSPNQTRINRFDPQYEPLLPYGFGLQYGDANFLPDTLSEDNESSNQQNLAALKIFDRSIQAPWKMALNQAGKRQAINSSVVAIDTLKFETIDRRVQEDAFSLHWNESQEGQFIVYHDFPEDLRAYTESKSVLRFDYQLKETPSAEIYLQMGCMDVCESDLNISEDLKVAPSGNWQSIEVELSCFSDKGVNFAQVNSPFAVRSSGNLSLSLSDISIQTQATDTQTISCLN